MNYLIHYLLIAPAILFALTIHEYFHAWMAYRKGDPTAKLAGRLTLNPLKHLDPIGTIMLFLFRFGWAKPVPVNPYNLQDPKKDMVWVSLAAPLSNLGSGILFCIILRIVRYFHLHSIPGFYPFYLIILFLVLYNLILCLFNLIPIFPLDGANVLYHLLPEDLAYEYAKIARFGPFILIAIILLGNLGGINILWGWIGPFVDIVSKVFAGEHLSHLL